MSQLPDEPARKADQISMSKQQAQDGVRRLNPWCLLLAPGSSGTQSRLLWHELKSDMMEPFEYGAVSSAAELPHLWYMRAAGEWTTASFSASSSTLLPSESPTAWTCRGCDSAMM